MPKRFSYLFVVNLLLLTFLSCTTRYHNVSTNKRDYSLFYPLLKDTDVQYRTSKILTECHVQTPYITIHSQNEAVDYAESILFKVYGEKHIKSERPYTLSRLNDYWLLSGTLPGGDYVSGGTFCIIFNEKDGKVVYLMHGK